MTARVGACAIALAVVPAWRAAPQVKPAPDLTTLVATLKSTDPATRAKSACALRDLGGRATAAVDALAALLPDASPVDQQICGQRWRSDDTSSPGEVAAAALASIGSPAYAVLERTLQHDIWIARRNAALALGVLDDPRAVDVATAALKDPDTGVRRAAVYVLAELGSGGGAR